MKTNKDKSNNTYMVIKKLIETNQSITCAESCTGGLIASEITKYSGVSSIFKGSIVSYSNDIKMKLLGVKENTLKNYGAVSAQCVSEMLDGVMDIFDSDFAIAVSGIAGPDGGSSDKPVGTVIIGVKNRVFGSKIKRFRLKGDRNFIQQSAVKSAFEMLLKENENFFLKKNEKTLDK
jgi:nicotinamide-nucleotide amidase